MIIFGYPKSSFFPYTTLFRSLGHYLPILCVFEVSGGVKIEGKIATFCDKKIFHLKSCLFRKLLPLKAGYISSACLSLKNAPFRPLFTHVFPYLKFENVAYLAATSAFLRLFFKNVLN